MSSAEAPASTNGSISGIASRLRASPRLGLILGVAFAVTVLAALLLWTRSPDYAVLYSGLSDRDGGDVVSKLEQMKVPYKLSAGGSTIRVPASDVDQTRLQLAGDGLPKGAGVGFELMDKQPFGISEFAEQVNYQRALDGELERSIDTIDEVSSARVQLAIPKSSVFVSQRQKPKASVILDLYHGRALSSGQVQAIQHLVSSAVPDLPADAVTIVDSSGHLLSGKDDDANGPSATRLAYIKRVEQIYQDRIQSLLAPIVGSSNLRAEVVASLDFTSRESTQESYTPNSPDKPAAVRSRQSNTQIKRSDDENGGVPGALSNQPTPDADSPINNPDQSGQNGNSRNGNGQNNGRNNNGNAITTNGTSTGLQNNGALGLSNPKYVSTSKNETTNYELNRTIAHITDPIGRIQRMSVAVVINQNAFDGKASTGGQGNTGAGNQGLSKARMDQIRSLVASAIGYSADRGDSIQVIQMPFSAPAATNTASRPPWWQNAWWQSLIVKCLEYIGLAIVAWLLWRRLVKPLAERSGLFADAAPARLATPAPARDENENEVSDDTAGRAERDTRRRRYEQTLATTQEAAHEDPDLVAMIVKGWMKADG